MKRKVMKKRIVSVVMVFALMLTCLAGCGKENEGKKSADIDMNETGYPIVNEPLTLKIGVMAEAAYQTEWDELEWVKQLEAESGINLEFVVYNDSQAVNLMFASEDYPDITFNVGSSKQIYEAAQGGAVYALDEYMEEYAPNWYNYFSENEDSLKQVTFEDGHIYSFPIVREEDYHYEIRDQWLINKTWLDELGLEIPETTDELYNVLKAFKANAGKGSIPKDVIPYYILGVLSNIGGALDVINSFGVRVSSEQYYVTVDDDGQVEFNFADKDIIEPMEFIHKLVEEKLIPTECFTDSTSDYQIKFMSDEKTVGVFHSYYDYSTEDNEYVAFGPLDTGNGKTPFIRSQANTLVQNMFTVYKTCEYPEIAVRLANMIAEPEWSIQASYGMLEEDSSLYKDEEGNYVARGGFNGYDYQTRVPSNRVPYLISEEIYNLIKFEDSSIRYQRKVVCDEVYKGKTIATENLYPFLIFSEDNMDELSELYLNVNTTLKQTFTRWAMYGNVEKEWDAYIKELEELGIDRYLELLQEEYDVYKNK